MASINSLPGKLSAMGDVYLDVVESAVSAYSDEHMMRYLEAAERDGVQEHGFPRLTANLAVLVANGRMADKLDDLGRMMAVSCKFAANGKMPLKSSGNEFSVKELAMALFELERAKSFPEETLVSWRTDLSKVDPWCCYSCIPQVGNERHGYNWWVFGAASEQVRIANGLGGDPDFVEKCVSDQIRWFDANGMWRDPHEPALYDIVTRLQFAAILRYGYDGPSRAKLDEFMDRSAEATLCLQSACGEMPYGGRSNQFLHNNTCYAALCEWYASRCIDRKDPECAARFKAAAKASTDALKPWLDVRPVRHVKNLYPVDGGIGCEPYAYFDKYMVTMGSWALMAREFATPCRAPSATKREAGVFATTSLFHWVFMNAGDYSAQFDYNAVTEYDCNGLGRIHRRGAPPQICLSTPCAENPNYKLAEPNDGPLAIMPTGAGKMILLKCDHTAASVHTEWNVEGRCWDCMLSDDGMEMLLSGKGAVAMALPVFEFDGESHTHIEADEHRVAVVYKGWKCVYETDGKIVNTGKSSSNRNGRYLRYEAHGEDRLSVGVTILPCR